MKKIALENWTLLGTLPYQAEFSPALLQGEDMPYMVPPIKASVPGCVYKDLWDAGIIENPYYDLGSLHCEWVANRWWIYRADFTIEKDDLSMLLHLTLRGIDYAAKIYINAALVGSHEGMYIPFDAIINNFVTAGKNKLVIVLENAPDAMGQAGYTSKTRHLKARFNYKWDFAGRLVSLGLYDDVTLTAQDGAYLENPLISTKCLVEPAKDGCSFELTATVQLCCQRVGKYQLSLRIDGEEHLTKSLYCIRGSKEITLKTTIENAKLWWPNGSGAQPLYQVTLTLFHKKEVCDYVKKQVGLRTLAHVKTEDMPDALEYQILVNGKKIYRKGTNIVPLTLMTGALPQKQLEDTLLAAKKANINFLRIWGGGHFESEAFYDLCDKYGLLVLQEFPLSSSGCDDLPSRDEHFLSLLRKALPGQLKRIVSHPSFCEFDGGNEMENFRFASQPDHETHAATFEDPILNRFLGWVNEYAPGAYMLPSSGSGTNTIYKKGDSANNHDVHGPWNYLGAAEHYDLYNGTSCIIHSEFGCAGMTNFDSMKEFLSPEHLRLTTALKDGVWYHHGGSWDGYEKTIRPLFGDLSALPLADYALINQYMQYEGLRYAIEAHRSRAWHTVGTMTWQFNEPWPNVECSNVYDFYGRKKLGYYALQEAYASVTASLQYDKLFWREGDCFEGRLTVQNDFDVAAAGLTVSICSLDGNTVYVQKKFNGMVKANMPTAMGNIVWTIPNIMSGFLVRISGKIADTAVEREYLMFIAEISRTELFYNDPVIKEIAEKCWNGDFADWQVALSYAKKLRERYPQ